MESEPQPQPLHILFFPFMAAGHIIPMVDMAKLFSSHGVAATILTTPGNADHVHPNLLHHPSITLHLIPFPSAAAGLPDGCENVASIPSNMRTNFDAAVALLRQPFDDTLSSLRPDAVVTDLFLPWTADIASSHSIPRIEFNGTGFFPICAYVMLSRHNTLHNHRPEALTLTIPSFPHKIEMLRSQIADRSPSFQQFIEIVKQAELKTYGVLVNSFYELEPDYAQHYRSIVGRRAWHVGPVSLCEKGESDRISHGRNATAGIKVEDCLSWLDSRSPGSVVYVCFGSSSDITEDQQANLALGLETCKHPFVWVVRQGLMPERFEERVKDRGLVIRGWAPQRLILEHSAVGAFVTHCGWNSLLEGVSAGVPMVTWPLYAEQFFNERLVVEVLGIGVAVGAKVYAMRPEERPLIEATAVEQAVRKVMEVDEEAEERKRKVKELRELAKKAVEEGGSSFRDVEELVKELMERKVRQEEKIIS